METNNLPTRVLLLQYCTTSTVATSTTPYYQVGTYLPSVVAEKREHCSFEKVKHNSNPRNHESSQSYLAHYLVLVHCRIQDDSVVKAASAAISIQHQLSAAINKRRITNNKQETRIDRKDTGHRSQDHSFQRFRQAGYNKFKNYIDLISYS